jgi:LemA protein
MTIGIIILVVVVLLLLWVATTYNGFVSLKNKVNDQWSQIDVQLKRRFDLIPNLVETVKGYAKHESDTLEDIVKARNAYSTAATPDDQMKADGELTKGISKLFALAESYPDLKANENFLSLQSELSETEDKISYARQFYNDIVMKYNTKVETFPSNIIANMFKFTKKDFFAAAENEKENVKVKF